ncbi:Alcohol-forming fatty acyl-CoA reductase [Sesamum angolense]|uniref:Fatty acyl-CoA reductase n=1 Tax=Sesamum angolense TaxID=2727404 RepID=A0AAE1XCN9_9LAMI|nr:Alcohol-forming fatty acyl-CoA reductase [Sesamum angolense]
MDGQHLCVQQSNGEMLLGHFKQNIPLVIIRPTIVTSTFEDPFPVGLKASGKITCFLGNPQTIIDLIPADMVVNAIIVAMVAHANQPNESIIYHVGSSVSSPVEFTWLQDYAFRYFTNHPYIDKHGKPVIVGKGLEILNTACCQYFQRLYLELSSKVKFVMRLIDLYGPYCSSKDSNYDDMNTEKLRRAAKKVELRLICSILIPKALTGKIFMNTHIPGVVKYVFK